MKSTLRRRFADRLEYLFAEASRLTVGDVREIRAGMAANGSLHSGATLKRSVGAIEARAREAVSEALASVDRQSIRDAQRVELRDQLREGLEEHMRSAAMKGLAFKWVSPPGGAAEAALNKLYVESAERLVAQIDQHATGLTDAKPANWVAAHPTLAFVITTGLSALAIIISLIALFMGGH
jgi:hypothetical protein